MLGSVPPVSPMPVIAHATYQLAKQGEWPRVFNQIDAYPGIAYISDQDPRTLGWTLFDHALFQRNVSAFHIMRNKLGISMVLQPGALLPHLRNGNWPCIYQLLKEQIIEPNTLYIDLEGNPYTLLDIALNLGKTTVAQTLRETHSALTYETIIKRAMFQAAREKNWELVYYYLNEKAERVDYIDDQEQVPCCLLEQAFLQRDNEVILTLIDEYHTDMELLLNTDPLLYDSVMGLYEYAKAERSVEQLIATLQTLDIDQSYEAPSNADNDQPQCIIPGFKQFTNNLSGIALLRQDYPGEDQKVTFRGQRLLI
ncbi:MAG: hypothetical protein AB7I18_01245 [Candidatus Berkiella sp.]